jgi:hypothetical protein
MKRRVLFALNSIAYHFFMAYSGPEGVAASRDVCKYCILAGVHAVAHMYFEEAFEYFSVAELTGSKNHDQMLNLLQHIRTTILLIQESQSVVNTRNSWIMSFKKSRRLLFGSLMLNEVSAETDSESNLSSSMSDFSSFTILDFESLKLKVKNNILSLSEKNEMIIKAASSESLNVGTTVKDIVKPSNDTSSTTNFGCVCVVS